MAPKKGKPPPEFDDPCLKDHTVVQHWKGKGFEDMALLKVLDQFLAAYRKDKSTKDKQAVKAAKRAKLPIPEPGPEMRNPKIDEPTFTKLLKTKMKIVVPDSRELFRAANTSSSGLMSFGEFVTVIGALKNESAPSEDKLNMVFRMYDGNQSGQLEAGEVQLLLDEGLRRLPTSEDNSAEAKQRQLDYVMKEMSVSEQKPWSCRDGINKAELEAGLRNESVIKEITPRGAGSTMRAAGANDGGISAEQLFEATVLKKPSRLCAIL